MYSTGPIHSGELLRHSCTSERHNEIVDQRRSGVKDRSKLEGFGSDQAVVDLFCGAGGLTYGLMEEGLDVVAGVDVDEHCQYAYQHNTGARFRKCDIEQLSGDSLLKLYGQTQVQILVGCAPCQPFSVYNQKNNDEKWKLIKRFAKLIVETRPNVVSMENVPRLLTYRGGSVFQDFVRQLENAGYHVTYQVVSLERYGLPQRRSRLVLTASLHGVVTIEPPNFDSNKYLTVEEAIGHLPAIAAGETHATDRLHTASQLSAVNLRRIRASMPGGNWGEWPEELRAVCHRQNTGRGYKSVYGRMRFDEVAPTITTQFYGFGNGRFGHPEQDRAISLREGAILQSFPLDYDFAAPNQAIHFKIIGRMIGNAVPVVLARVIGRSITRHLVDRGLLRRVDQAIA